MTCNDSYSAPRRPYNERRGVRIYRNILFKENELVEACRVRRGFSKRRYYTGREEAGRRNLRGDNILLREYIYIYIEEERMPVKVYREEECVCRPRGFRIMIGDGRV